MQKIFHNFGEYMIRPPTRGVNQKSGGGRPSPRAPPRAATVRNIVLSCVLYVKDAAFVEILHSTLKKQIQIDEVQVLKNY